MQLLCRTRNKDRRTCERSKAQMDEGNITNETDEQGQMQKLCQELLGSTQTTPVTVSRWMDTFFMYKPLTKIESPPVVRVRHMGQNLSWETGELDKHSALSLNYRPMNTLLFPLTKLKSLITDLNDTIRSHLPPP